MADWKNVGRIRGAKGEKGEKGDKGDNGNDGIIESSSNYMELGNGYIIIFMTEEIEGNEDGRFVKGVRFPNDIKMANTDYIVTTTINIANGQTSFSPNYWDSPIFITDKYSREFIMQMEADVDEPTGKGEVDIIVIGKRD